MNKVLTIGDIILDQYDVCSLKKAIEHVEIYNFNYTKYMLGGAANVAKCVKSRNVDSHLYGYIGNDSAGKVVKDLLNDIGQKNVHVVDALNTTVKNRLVVNNEIKCRVDYENNVKICSREFELDLLSSIDMYSSIIISDYQKGVLNRDFIRKIVKVAVSKDIPIFIDSKSSDMEQYNGADYAIITLDEYNQIMKTKFNSLFQVGIYGFSFLNMHSVKNLIIKNNVEGSMLFSHKNKQPVHTVDKAEAVCAIGAGDVYISNFCVEILNGSSIENAFRVANMKAAKSVESFFTCCEELIMKGN